MGKQSNHKALVRDLEALKAEVVVLNAELLEAARVIRQTRGLCRQRGRKWWPWIRKKKVRESLVTLLR